MAAWEKLIALPAQFWKLARHVEELFELQQQTRDALASLTSKIQQLDQRLTYLEASQTQVITEAKAAASAASTIVAGGVLSEVVTRLTRLEVRVENLPPPRNQSSLPAP
jgi:phage shock protein A